MHRTTTTATLLVTVAASALTGCVTVQHHPPAPGASAVPSVPPLPRPDGKARARVIQAPAREALEMVAPSNTTPAPRERAQEREPEAPPPARPHDDPLPKRRSHPHRPTTPHDPAAPRIEIPDVESEVRRNTDVCALGRQYGGWRNDSPEARICDQAYGR
ncbi:hypothetical protein IAG44_33920 [Streptomyces roseirectus]|uniref:Lipoprotein n=1 Tax=Streptomyces roseirectus TaxID=2768066 RepID=A0A7H0IMF0_9ACTN|nr:hypothetical protein [Streptomyces roseirectus]QNP73966.1 hypothetical protein IAG44_33920 [Streptomyces roseirectus]